MCSSKSQSHSFKAHKLLWSCFNGYISGFFLSFSILISDFLCLTFVSAGIGHQRTTVGFVERRLKDTILERVELPQADRETIKPSGVVSGTERGGPKSRGGAERAVALLRAQRSLSPEGHRSSSLPPPAHRNIPTATPSE